MSECLHNFHRRLRAVARLGVHRRLVRQRRAETYVERGVSLPGGELGPQGAPDRLDAAAIADASDLLQGLFVDNRREALARRGIILQ